MFTNKNTGSQPNLFSGAGGAASFGGGGGVGMQAGATGLFSGGGAAGAGGAGGLFSGGAGGAIPGAGGAGGLFSGGGGGAALGGGAGGVGAGGMFGGGGKIGGGIVQPQTGGQSGMGGGPNQQTSSSAQGQSLFGGGMGGGLGAGVAAATGGGGIGGGMGGMGGGIGGGMGGGMGGGIGGGIGGGMGAGGMGGIGGGVGMAGGMGGGIGGGMGCGVGGGIAPPASSTGKEGDKGLTFGETIHQKGSPIKTGANISRDALSSHMTVEELFKNWKGELEEQVNKFLTLGKDLNKNEREFYEILNMLTNLNSNLKQMENDYGHAQGQLGGLENQQDDLLKKLNSIEQEIEKSLGDSQNDQIFIKSENLISKAKDLNKEAIQIEDSLIKLVEEINQPFKDSNEDISKILNSYYDALEFIEMDTLEMQSKLNLFEQFIEKKGLK